MPVPPQSGGMPFYQNPVSRTEGTTDGDPANRDPSSGAEEPRRYGETHDAPCLRDAEPGAGLMRNVQQEPVCDDDA
jgi:hypothetical protein